MNTQSDTKRKWKGSRWIRQERRLAIYLRDGLACCYCGSGLEHNVLLTLDHVHPRSEGGGNESSNLVTSCEKCNSVRGSRSLNDWVKVVAAYLNHGIEHETILQHVRECLTRQLDIPAAVALIAKRGSYSKALHQPKGE